MKKGKYQAQRRRRRRINWTGVIFWLVVLTLLITLVVFLFRGCSPAQQPPETNPPVSTGSVQTMPPTNPPKPTVPPTTAPTVPPTTAPTEAPTIPPTTAPVEETEPAVGQAVADLAKSLLGKGYAYGGTGPDTFDTSGLIYYCFRQCDISAPRKMSDQYAFGEPVQKDALQPGDVVFFSLDTPNEAEYVGIYVGDNVFIAVSSSNNAVELKNLQSSYFSERFLGARRYS